MKLDYLSQEEVVNNIEKFILIIITIFLSFLDELKESKLHRIKSTFRAFIYVLKFIFKSLISNTYINKTSTA